MSDDLVEKKVSFWLQEAKELMVAADLCWKSDEAFQRQIAEGKFQGINNRLLQMQIDSEVELNWLYNLLAGLAVYYLAVGVLLSLQPQREFGEHSERHIVDLVEACGIKLDNKQRDFLKRVESAMTLADKEGAWNISLKPAQMKLMKQRYAQQHAVSSDVKLAMDGLMGQLINLALYQLSHEQA